MASKKLIEIDPIKLLLEKNRQLEDRVAKAEARPVVRTEVKSEADEILDLDEDGKRFLFQVRGIKGERGEKGERGIQGERGLTGLQGVAGRDGKDGKNGLDGRNGINGKDGKDGKKGKDGKDGKHAREFTAGTTKPSSAKENDVFLDSSSGELYKYIDGKWKKIGDLSITGPKGDNGAQGLIGPPGVGVPTGGTAGQVLAKINGDDYNTQWVNDQTGGSISDDAYDASGWDNVTTIAPSKNAVRDKIESMQAQIDALYDLVTYTQYGGF
jgi:hypothetical protein